MFSWLKKHFIPHAGNNHRPHFLRTENVRVLLIAIILIEGITFFAPTLSQINVTGNLGALVLPGVLADLTNEERQAQNIPALTVNPVLTAAAEAKANDMATKGYFAHTSPEGKTPWYWFEQAGYNYKYAGENLAINFTDSEDVTRAWMNSPTHRANIVKGKYTEVGTGVATGMYEGKETVFVAQLYASPGTPAPVALTTTAKPAVPAKTTTVPVASETAPSVLGEQTVATAPVTPVVTAPKPLTLTTASIDEPTVVEKALSSPRHTTNRILFLVGIIVLVAVLINLFARVRHVHIDLVTNGLIIIAFIGIIFIFNYYVSDHKMVVLETADTSMNF